MFDYDKWQEIFNTIRKNKLRTFLTALGVWWGIFMLILLMGAGTGLENGVLGLFGSHARNALYVWPNRTTMPYEGLPPGRIPRLTNEDIRAIEQQLADRIDAVAPRLYVNAGEVRYKDRRGGFDVRGDDPDLLQIDALRVVQGRFINERDLREARKVVAIGQRVKTQLFSQEEAIGKRIRILGNEFLVVGILQSDRRGEDAQQDENNIIMPLTTAQRITNRPNRVGWFVCTVNERFHVAEVEQPLLALLKKRHRVHPDDPQGFGSDNVEQEYRELTNLFGGIKFIVWFVGIGSLLAGIIGVGNIMLIIVRERTKEIGIRKALGATPGSIISMILLESVFITTIAGYLGLLTSTGLVYLMALAAGTELPFFTNPEIHLGVGVAALLILVVSGALTGLVPALQAARINPVEALRDE